MNSTIRILVFCSLAALVLSQELNSNEADSQVQFAKRSRSFAFAKRFDPYPYGRAFAFAKRSSEEPAVDVETELEPIDKRARFAFAKRARFAFAKRARFAFA